MDLKGEITATELAEIFQMLTQTRKEGTLTVVNRDRKKAIYFSKQGVTLLFDSQKKSGSLGQMLLDYHKVTPQQLEHALQVQKESGHRLGEILAGMGIVTLQEIEDLVHKQIEEEIFDLLSWRGGNFEFSEGQRKAATISRDRPLTNLLVDPNSLLMEAARRLDEWQVIESLITSGNDVPLRNPHKREAPEEQLLQTVLGAVGDTNTVDEIVEKTMLSKFEAYSALYQLLEGRWLRLASIEELINLAELARQNNQPVKCLKLYQAAVHRQPEDVNLRTRFAKLAEQLGDKSRALIQYEWLARKQIDSKRIEQAIPLLTRIKELDSNNLFAREGLFQAALRLGQKAPASQEGQFLIDAYRSAHNLEQAKLVAERLLGLSPNDPVRLRTLVDILVEKGETTAAIRQCEQLAGILDRQGNERELEQIYELMLGLDRSRRDIRERLRHIGRRAAARRKRMLVLGGCLAAVVLVGGIVTLVVMNKLKLARVYRDTTRQADALAAKGSFAEALDLYHTFIDEHNGTSWAERAQDKVKDLQAKHETQQAELATRMASLRKRAAQAQEDGKYQESLALLKELAPLVSTAEQAKLNDEIKLVERIVTDIGALFDRAQKLEKKGDLTGARRVYMQLVRDHPKALAYIKVKLPVQVVSAPAGAELSIDGERLGITPTVVHYPPLKNPTLKLTKAGFKEQTVVLKDDANWQPGVIQLPKLTGWHFATAGVIEASPVVAGNRVIIGSRDGKIYALDIATGRLLWDFKAPKFEAFTSAAAVTKDKVYVTTNTEGSVIAIRLDTGEKIWQFDTKALMRCRPCVTPAGLICVGSSDKHLYALAESQVGTPEVRWKFQAEASIRCSAGYSEGKLYFGSDDGKVYCISADQGQELWNFPTQAEVSASPVIKPDTVYVGSGDGYLYALDAQSGKLQWKFKTGGKVVSSPCVYQGQVLVGSMDGKLYRIDTSTHQAVWSYDTGKPITASPCCQEETVYVGSNDGSLYALQFDSGKLIWKGSTGDTINSAPVVGNGFVIVGSDDKKIYAFAIAH